MAANSDVLYADTVKGLNLKSVSRYVAYALTEVVKGLTNVPNGREVIVHRPFDVIRNKVVTTNRVSLVYPTDYMALCTSEDPDYFVQQHKNSENYTLRVIATTLQYLSGMAVMRHVCFYKVVNKITDAPGTISYIIGYDFGGYEDLAALGQDWFLFTQKRRIMDM